jgi:hypothetical protein
MKTFAFLFALSAVAFLVFGYQTGLLEMPGVEVEGTATTQAVEQDSKQAPDAAGRQFPEDLEPACRGAAVPGAAVFDPKSGRPHRLVFLYDTGKLRSEWQEMLDEDWLAERVEQTELVVVVSKDEKTLINVQYYPNGAPPISRYQYDLYIRVVAARTGRVLARNHFVSTPRRVRGTESWELTAIGQPVSFTTVFNWVKSHALAGFPTARATTMRRAPVTPKL